MTNWWWIRHGPTHHKGLVGWSDIAADLSNVSALKRLQAHLPEDGLVVSSDLQRCVTTANAIQGARIRLPHNDKLREFNFGDWELRNASDIAKEYPDLSKEYWANPGETAPPHGESWNQAAKRVCSAIDAISAEHQGKNIIAVGHFGVILTQIQRAAKMPASSAISFQIDNLSITKIEYLGGTDWRVLGVNFKP